MPRFHYAVITAIVFSLPTTAVQATVTTDLDKGLPLTQVINNALEDEQPLEQILADLVNDCEHERSTDTCDLEAPLKECEIIREDERASACNLEADLELCNPVAFEEEFKRFRFSQFAEIKSESCGGDYLQAIGQAALNAGLTEEQLIQAALGNGIDPTAILPPAAAGETAPQPTITPPPFGTNQTGGGSAASAS